MSRKRKITKELIDEAYKLSKAGFSHKQIYEALNISHTAFYKNVELVDTVKKAENELRAEVSESLLLTAKGGDTTALIFLAKRLNLFTSSFEMKIKDSKTALEGLSKLINENIPLEQKNSIKGIIEAYIKGVETVELEERIKKLEEMINEK